MGKRPKRLYGVVDEANQIGWSIKAIQSNIALGGGIGELVIQRADIFKKGVELGFGSLHIETPEHVLGQALLTH